jgi:hypothetical protein
LFERADVSIVGLAQHEGGEGVAHRLMVARVAE